MQIALISHLSPESPLALANQALVLAAGVAISLLTRSNAVRNADPGCRRIRHDLGASLGRSKRAYVLEKNRAMRKPAV